MTPMITGFAVAGVPLFLLGLVAPSRWRIIGAAIVAVGAVIAGVSAGALVPMDVVVVPMGVGMELELLSLLLWAVFAAGARTMGPLNLPGPPFLVALTMGALLGEVPAAAILGAGARDAKGAARLALCAAGGGMLGRVGDPAMLLIANRDFDLVLWMIPLGFVCALLARPSADDLVRPEDDAAGSRTLAILGIAIAACVPGWTPVAIGVGIVLLFSFSKGRPGPVDLARAVWILLAAIVGLIAVVGGVAELAATGLEMVWELVGGMAPVALCAAAALLTALTDGVAMSVVGLGILDRAMGLEGPAPWRALMAGVAVGGLAPLIVVGAFRAGWRIWLAQVAVAVVYVGLLA